VSPNNTQGREVVNLSFLPFIEQQFPTVYSLVFWKNENVTSHEGKEKEGSKIGQKVSIII